MGCGSVDSGKPDPLKTTRNTIGFAILLFWENSRNSNLDWLYPLHCRIKKWLCCTFQHNQECATFFTLKYSPFATFRNVRRRIPSFCHPSNAFEWLFYGNSMKFPWKPIRNLRLEHRFCKFASIEKGFGLSIPTGYPHSILDQKVDFLHFSPGFNLEHIFKAKKVTQHQLFDKII